MNIVTSITELKKQIKAWKQEGKTIGLVPTMGYLHPGHASLIRRAVVENDVVVVSDFVNPIQFGPNEDLAMYPRDINADAKLCEDLGTAVLFAPTPEEMYHNPCVSVVVESMTDTLCGSKRPGHFNGVCTVVLKLFNLVEPTRAYFGEKDAQQVAIVKKMVEDLNVNVEIIPCPIVREVDGLAMSSRNTYLNTKERIAALCLSRAVANGRQFLDEHQLPVTVKELLDVMRPEIDKEPLARIDYLEVVDKATMQPVDLIDRPVLIAMAVYIGKTRLIDNFSY